MRVTVCQLDDAPAALEKDWDALVAHVRRERPTLVLLPELPFHSWFAGRPVFDRSVWDAAIAAHATWRARLVELAPAAVVATVPRQRDNQRLNEAVLFEHDGASQLLHAKRYLPDQNGFYEARWFDRGPNRFDVTAWAETRLGVLICSELWFVERARAYGRAGANVILTPRATVSASLERWILAARVAAISAGAYCLSSNRTGVNPDGPCFAGAGWVMGPEGDVLATTSAETPFATIEIDLAAAARARTTYPRNLAE